MLQISLLEVLASLEKNNSNSAPAAFPLHSQYVKNVLEGRAAAGLGNGEDSGGEKENVKPPPKKKKKTKSVAVAPPKSEKTESGWNYSSVRAGFINDLKAKGKTYKESTQIWDESMEKARFLAPVTVGELKKRRFLSAGSTENPW